MAYCIASFLGYVMHWALHRRWTGKLNRSHMAHHIELYPPKDLMSDSYRSAGHMSTVWTFVMAFIPLIIIPVIFACVGVLSLLNAISVIAAMIIVGILNDVIHDSYHVNNHWLRKFPGYAKAQHLHFVHHRRMKKNMGIYEFNWDRMFGTYRK